MSDAFDPIAAAVAADWRHYLEYLDRLDELSPDAAALDYRDTRGETT